MKRNLVVFSLFVVVLGLGLILTVGCAKKVVKETAEEKTATVQKEAAAAAQPAETEEQRLAREKAMKEAAMKEAALKEEQERERALAAQKEKEAAAAAIAAAFADLRFDFDKFDLKPEARETLKKAAAYMLAGKDVTVVIEGNCDERGTVEYNLALGEKRALSAMKFLVDLGVDKGRIKTISYGKERPLDPGHTEEAWAKNRRDHFVVTEK
jgi:peptidoglycan-associated lipoprotein